MLNPTINDLAALNERVIRALTTDIRVDESESGIIEGYAIVFEKIAAIGGYFTESVARSALAAADLSDVKLHINHNIGGVPLARCRRGKRSTMTLTIDDVGLKFRAELDIDNNAEARKLYSAIKRGDIVGMSFMFTVKTQEWRDLDKDVPHRTIIEISKVFEVSAVNDPAYAQTSINARGTCPLEDAKCAVTAARQVALDNEKLIEADLEALEMRKRKLKLKFGGHTK